MSQSAYCWHCRLTAPRARNGLCGPCDLYHRKQHQLPPERILERRKQLAFEGRILTRSSRQKRQVTQGA